MAMGIHGIGFFGGAAAYEPAEEGAAGASATAATGAGPGAGGSHRSAVPSREGKATTLLRGGGGVAKSPPRGTTPRCGAGLRPGPATAPGSRSGLGAAGLGNVKLAASAVDRGVAGFPEGLGGPGGAPPPIGTERSSVATLDSVTSARISMR